MADQSTFDSLCALLAQEGIDTVPQLSAELQSRLATDGRGWFYTDTVDTDPRDVSAWLDHLTQRTDDFFAAGFRFWPELGGVQPGGQARGGHGGGRGGLGLFRRP